MYKSALWVCTHYGGHFAQDHGFDTVEAFIKHVLENLDNATSDKKHKNGISYFVFTKPFYSTIHPDRKKIYSLIVSLYEGNDYRDIINMWRGKQSYIENKKEQEQPYPPIGLSHTSDETEVATGKIEAGSDFTHSTETQNLPLSDDKGMKKINNTNEAWEATSNPQSARSTMSIGAR